MYIAKLIRIRIDESHTFCFPVRVLTNRNTMVLRNIDMQDQQLPSNFCGIITEPPQPQLQSQAPTQPQSVKQILPVPNPIQSYWLTQPSPHANLRSTPSLPSNCDIAIIGSGMSGILTLYHILSNSPQDNLPKIVLLDARSLCSGATARNGGHAKVKTATLAGMKTGKERNEFQNYVHGVMRDLKDVVDAKEGLAEECEFEIRRSFDVFQDPVELKQVKDVYDEAVKNGEEWCKSRQFIGKDDVEQITSIKGAIGAFSCPASSLWPYKFVAGVLRRVLERHGMEGEVVNVQMNTPVTAITSEDQGNILTTPRGNIKARKVVFATNAYTAGLLPTFNKVITPVKGMASHHTPARPIHPHLNNTYNIHFAPIPSGKPTGTDYLNPRPDGSIVVGGGNWFYSHNKSVWNGNFDDSTQFPAPASQHWEKYMQSTFLGWENSNAKADMIWTGIQGYTSDGMPHVGRVPGVEGQWILAGFNGGGMAQIATAARAVAKMVRQDKGFEDVREEFGLLGGMATSGKRLAKDRRI
jgi:glycine/D-amino acid oxidase-like deaminating enzyme